MFKPFKAVMYTLVISILACLTYSIWFVNNWSYYIENAASETIQRPKGTHNVVLLDGWTEKFPLILDLIMEGIETVVIRSTDYGGKYTAFSAGAGSMCSRDNATHKHWFVILGFYNKCLIKERVEEPQNAIVVRVVMDHEYKYSALAELFVLPPGSNPAPLGNDAAWIVDVVERVNGKETLLGRASATELPRKGEARGGTEFHYWPNIPEINQRRSWRFTNRDKWRPFFAREKWGFAGPEALMWSSGFYTPVDFLSYVLSQRTMGVKLNLSWMEEAEPNIIKSLDYAESLIFSPLREERQFGSNMLAEILSHVSSKSYASESIKETVISRATSIGLKTLNRSPEMADHSMVHRFIIYNVQQVNSEGFKQLLTKLAENAFVLNVPDALEEFHQAQRYFDKMTFLFPEHICKASEGKMAKYEREHKLCK